MQCEFCSNTATVHLTDIINKKKRETHLCEACAREKKLITDPPQELNVPALLQLVLGQLPFGEVKVDPSESPCPECGAQYGQFRSQGRLGCPHDYIFFQSLLEPLLERIQCNGTQHIGKIPNRQLRQRRRARKCELDAELRAAVKTERYEDAARIRDEIRALGGDHES